MLLSSYALTLKDRRATWISSRWFLCCHQSRQKTFASHQERLSALRLEESCFFEIHGRYDMAQLRFKPEEIDENFYVRRDGTSINLCNCVSSVIFDSLSHSDHLRHFTLCQSYYFAPDESSCCSRKRSLETQCDYLHRRTINVKEGVDVERIFVQGSLLEKIAIIVMHTKYKTALMKSYRDYSKKGKISNCIGNFT